MEMSQTLSAPAASAPPAQSLWPQRFRRLGIWAGFFAVLYLARDFFFIGFMTFLFSYLALALVEWLMKRCSPARERPGWRRLVTVGVFLFLPLTLLVVGCLIGPELLAQGHRLTGWLSRVSPESEVAGLLEGVVGPAAFQEEYPGADDPKYKTDLEEFRRSGVRHVRAYHDFPRLEAAVEGSFSSEFTETERSRIRLQLSRAGSTSKAFEQWFLTEKVPQWRKPVSIPDTATAKPPPLDPLVRMASTSTPQQLLEQARREPGALSLLHQEWLQEAVEKGVAAARQSAAYQVSLRTYYERQQQRRPGTLPYTFAEYLALKQVRPQGPVAFGQALEKLRPTTDPETQVRADFQAAKEHEFFEDWWSANPTAKVIRGQLDRAFTGQGDVWMHKVLATLISIPIDLGTALLLSLFICIDFPNLKRAFQSLRETWLREVYDEIVPALHSLGHLIGLSMHAQGLIALCNATMVFVALEFLGVEHSLLLGGAVFVLCLVPTLGALIALVLIAAVALIQPGGGMTLAVEAALAVVFVILMESFVLSPRILGKMMELHPVLVIAILPVAQYFFGIWGLILAIPVAVYVIYEVILERGLPGSGGRSSRPATPVLSPPPELVAVSPIEKAVAMTAE